MNRIPLLKTLVSIMFFMAIIAFFFVIPFIFMLWVMPERVPATLTLKGLEQGESINIEATLYIFALLAAYGFFTYALYLFRKILDLFAKRILFDLRTISALDQAGKAIITGCTIEIAATFIYKVVTSNPVEINLNFGLDSTIAIICLGLFFMVLSQVFLMAKRVKDENDMTV